MKRILILRENLNMGQTYSVRINLKCFRLHGKHEATAFLSPMANRLNRD
jgi:hypothetical protein